MDTFTLKKCVIGYIILWNGEEFGEEYLTRREAMRDLRKLQQECS